MPFAPGTPKPAGSGRKKGNGNKATVAAILADLGCDPIEGMVRIAMDDKTKPELRGRMYAELAQYRWPKLRAMELTGGGGGPIETHDSARELLISRIDSLAARIAESRGPEKPDGSTG